METLTSWYFNQTNQKKLIFDNSQLVILQQLDKFIDTFNTNIKWYNFLHKPKQLGYYIYGDVGRGKSMIMDALFYHINTPQKLRIHFHQFMQMIQTQMNELNSDTNRINTICANLAKKYKIIFLDEMHVSDIANAMILRNLFDGLFNEKIHIITSSNYAPDSLYQGGLQRDRFLPAIALIKQRLNILSLNTNTDYRLVNAQINQLFFINDPQSEIKLKQIFDKFSTNKDTNKNKHIEINSRHIQYLLTSNKIIWFDFKTICGDRRSQIDYIELIKQFDWIILSGIDKLTTENQNIARRFTWLIDVIYDNNTKLAISSKCNLSEIYLEGDFINEFNRTLSRLSEMQTIEYLHKQNRILGATDDIY